MAIPEALNPKPGNQMLALLISECSFGAFVQLLGWRPKRIDR